MKPVLTIFFLVSLSNISTFSQNNNLYAFTLKFRKNSSLIGKEEKKLLDSAAVKIQMATRPKVIIYSTLYCFNQKLSKLTADRIDAILKYLVSKSGKENISYYQWNPDDLPADCLSLDIEEDSDSDIELPHPSLHKGKDKPGI